MIEFQESVHSYLSGIDAELQIIMNYESNHGHVVDVYLPQHQLGIALHAAEQSSLANLKKLTELKSCTSLTLIHIWEDQWLCQRGIIESRLLSALGKSSKIHGRQTIVKSIDNAVLLEFLAQNHLQVPIKARHRYGLFHRGQLVAVASFSKGRPIDRDGESYNSFELMRFCNKNGLTVVGGLSKLLKHFIREVHPDDIMTYLDKDWPGGQGFTRLGFQHAGELPVIELWFHIQLGTRHYPHRVIQSAITQKVAVEVSMLTDRELSGMGYRRVYAGGSIKLVLKIRA